MIVALCGEPSDGTATGRGSRHVTVRGGPCSATASSAATASFDGRYASPPAGRGLLGEVVRARAICAVSRARAANSPTYHGSSSGIAAAAAGRPSTGRVDGRPVLAGGWWTRPCDVIVTLASVEPARRTRAPPTPTATR